MSKKTKAIGDSNKIMVPVFRDEYHVLALPEDTTVRDARAILRARLGVANATRERQGGNGVSSIARRITEATPEQREAIQRILMS